MAQTRAVLLRHAVGAIGHESPGNDRNDALVADPSLVGLTVSWLPGDSEANQGRSEEHTSELQSQR